MIKGLTDQHLDQNILGRIEITVFKGDRKSERTAGKSLETQYRIVTNNPRFKKLLRVYGKPDSNGDILTDEIRVIFPFDEPERTFATAMKSYSASGLEVVCDREIISQKMVQETDAKGNVFRPIRQCSEPCPVADQPIGFQCPNRCQPTGELYFYIRELFEVGLMVPAKMTVHAYSDITYVSTQLERMRYELGSITNSPFPCYVTQHKVPFTLTRSEVQIKRPVVAGKQEGYKRTGKKAPGTAWAVEISPDENYLNLLQAWKQAQEMQRMQISLPQSAIAGLLNCDPTAIIDVQVVEEKPKVLPSKADRMRDRILQLAQRYEQQTGSKYLLPEIEDMGEEDLLKIGTQLKSVVNNI